MSDICNANSVLKFLTLPAYSLIYLNSFKAFWNEKDMQKAYPAIDLKTVLGNSVSPVHGSFHQAPNSALAVS